MTDRGTLLAALEVAATRLPGAVAEVAATGEIAWTCAGKRFAILRADSVELRVGAAIAAAAVRTPDTAGSNRGADWIVFAPETMDGHALDRLEAWLAAAHRRAAD